MIISAKEKIRAEKWDRQYQNGIHVILIKKISKRL